MNRFGLRDHRPLPDRIVRRIVFQPDGCWIWQGAITDRGYGHVQWINNKLDYLHRIMYEHFIGPIPEGKQIDHLCRNRACAYPVHMEIVTNAENSRRGSKAKLTQAQVDEIRRRRKNGERIEALSREFGIDAGHCSALCSGYRNMWGGV